MFLKTGAATTPPKFDFLGSSIVTAITKGGFKSAINPTNVARYFEDEYFPIFGSYF